MSEWELMALMWRVRTNLIVGVRDVPWFATHKRQCAANQRHIDSVIRDAQAIYGP
jgi:hypothetical protein